MTLFIESCKISNIDLTALDDKFIDGLNTVM